MNQKNILIVGGSSGIGLAVAETLTQQGANVYVASRNYSAPLQTLPIKAHFFLDVLQPVAEQLNGNLPAQLDGLVYCPGTINLKPFHRLSQQDFLNDLQINVLGAVQVIQACLPNLKKSAEGASIVLFSTVAVKLGMNFHSSIALSKGAVEGLTKSLAAEFAMSKIRVNAIAPSLTDTPLANALLSTPEKREASDKRHPIGRIGTSNDLASATVFLLNNQHSGWLTGQVLGIDGGMGSIKNV